ncbi:retroviral-like aspartic protease family protein [Flavobacteriaceae bacterium]|nr:retroviral-like aspartic protease family protein [Flavobacteriaceae bacterium]
MNTFSQCIDGDCDNGFGTYIYSDRSPYERYEGQWKNRSMNGEGKLYFRNGIIYIGQIINDTINGIGKLESRSVIKTGLLKAVYDNNSFSIILDGPEGTYYDKKNNISRSGFFQNDQLNGQGQIQYENQIQYGSFIDNKLNGNGIIEFINGDRFEGVFKNGQRNGYGVQTTPKGGELRGRWLNNEFIDGSDYNNPDAIDLIVEGPGAYSIEVNFQGQLTIPMVLDTGADLVLLKRENFSSLLAEGNIKEIITDDANFSDASGNTNKGIIYVISEITIGNFTISNVPCAVNPSANQAPNLLGMSALRKLGDFIKIDFNKNQLIVD